MNVFCAIDPDALYLIPSRLPREPDLSIGLSFALLYSAKVITMASGIHVDVF